MASESGYQLVTTGTILRYLQTLRSAERLMLIDAFEKLASDPFLDGDYQEYDQDGRLVEVVLRGRFSLVFWADHAVKEFRIVRVNRL